MHVHLESALVISDYLDMVEFANKNKMAGEVQLNLSGFNPLTDLYKMRKRQFFSLDLCRRHVI
jgi:hypothetical protein